jgi:hypothetical protein
MRNLPGGFDSHVLPPYFIRQLKEWLKRERLLFNKSVYRIERILAAASR